MSSATKRVPRRKPRKTTAPLWQSLGPLLLALVLTPFAVRLASILALSGPASLRLLYPWIAFVHAHLFTLSGPQIETVEQWTMWLMLPAYGLIVIVVRRISSLASGVLLVVLLHGLAVLTAIAFA